jgi:quercetin dioxygenase-like cupin family protein
LRWRVEVSQELALRPLRFQGRRQPWFQERTPMSDQPAPPLKRTPIAEHPIDATAADVERVTVVRLDFKPGQPTGRHTHPVPVIGYVLEGEFIVQVEGQPERRYGAGQSIHEPANTTMARFDNASSTAPAALIAHYLVGGDETELIRFLPER